MSGYEAGRTYPRTSWRDGDPLEDHMRELREQARSAADAGYHRAASKLEHKAWQLKRGNSTNEPVDEPNESQPRTPEIDYII